MSTNEDCDGRRVRAPAARRPRFHLLTLMLLIAAIAVWMANWQINRDIDRMTAELPGLRDAARLLRVDDANQYAVVRKHELWSDDFRWEVYLPPGHRYVLRLATEAVDERGLTVPALESPINSGRHAVQLMYEKEANHWRVEVSVDGQRVLHGREPLSWQPGGGSVGGSQVETNAQQDLGGPLVLFRRRWMIPKGSGGFGSPPGPGDGILLWIEPEAVATRP